MKYLSIILFAISIQAYAAEFYKCDNSVVTDQPWHYLGCKHIKTGEDYSATKTKAEESNPMIDSLNSLSDSDYVANILNRTSELVAITKVGAVKASDCDWNLKVHGGDQDGSCLAVVSYFKTGSRYIMILDFLAKIDDQKFYSIANPTQQNEYNLMLSEFGRNANKMKNAFDFYSEFLKN